MDATGMGEQPKRNTNPVASLYFVIFILFGSFLVMNLFVGAVVDNFNRQTDKVDQGENQDNVSAGAADKYIQHDEGDDNLDKFDEEGATSLFLRQKAAKQSAAQVMTTPGQSAFIDSVNLVFSRKPITRPVPPDPERLCFRLRRWCYNVVMWGPTKLTADGKGKRKVGNFADVVCFISIWERHFINTTTFMYALGSRWKLLRIFHHYGGVTQHTRDALLHMALPFERHILRPGESRERPTSYCRRVTENRQKRDVGQHQ